MRFPKLKPSTTAISLRLPVTLLERIKVAANKRDVPYQSLIKTWLAEKTGTRSRLSVSAGLAKMQKIGIFTCHLFASRTNNGKLQSRRNAMRHGLTPISPKLLDPL